MSRKQHGIHPQRQQAFKFGEACHWPAGGNLAALLLASSRAQHRGCCIMIIIAWSVCCALRGRGNAWQCPALLCMLCTLCASSVGWRHTFHVMPLQQPLCTGSHCVRHCCRWRGENGRQRQAPPVSCCCRCGWMPCCLLCIQLSSLPARGIWRDQPNEAAEGGFRHFQALPATSRHFQC